MRGGGERLLALLASEAAALAVLDSGGRIVMANRSFAALVMRPKRNLQGAEPASLFLDEHAAAIRHAVAAALSGRAAPAFEARLRATAADPDAGADVFCRPLRGEPGALLRLTDVTEQRQLRAQLAAASRLQAVGQLAGGVAHDFNNLLATIVAAAEAALATPGTASVELRQILDSAARGAALVRQLLAFASAQPMQPCLLRLQDVVASAEPLLRRLVGPGMELRLVLDRHAPAVRLDPAQLDQVLLNLAANARDAMPEGGTLRIAVRDVTLARRLAGVSGPVPPGRWVTLDVADQGSGIPRAILPRVFDPFFTTRRGRGGTGLGLSTVLGVVRQSDGHLSVRSREGVGARFRLWFPPAAGEAEAPSAEPELVGVPRSLRVLLVEDEAPLRRLTRRALEAAGFTVVEAGDAEEACTEARRNAPDVVVTDLMLGADDGLALAEALRRGRPGLPVILISGYAEGVVGRDLSAEGLRFLSKPFRMAELVAAIWAIPDFA